MKDLKDIQIEIKKELGGVSFNHLIAYMSQIENKYRKRKFILFVITSCKSGTIQIQLDITTKVVFVDYYALINQQNQALNIFGQSEGFQRNLYDVIQFIKNINNK